MPHTPDTCRVCAPLNASMTGSNSASDGSMSVGGRKEGTARLAFGVAPGNAGGGGTGGALGAGCLLPIELIR